MPYWGDEELEVYVEEGATPTYQRSTRRAFIGETEPDLNEGDLWFDPSEGTAVTRAAGDVTFSDAGLTVITGVSNVQAALGAVDAALTGYEAAWTSYTPSWTGSVSNPTIGDGQISGAYNLVGKTLYFRIYVAAGSTTTFGSGNYGFSLPGGITTVSGVQQSVSAWFEDNSPTVTRYQASGLVTSGTNLVARVVYGTGAGISATAPFTFAANDKISITGVIEVQ